MQPSMMKILADQLTSEQLHEAITSLLKLQQLCPSFYHGNQSLIAFHDILKGEEEYRYAHSEQ